MMVQEIQSRKLRDRRAVARYAGSRVARRERFETAERDGNVKRDGKRDERRMNRGLIQLAWRFLIGTRKNSELAKWYRHRGPRGRAARARTTMISVELARKLLLALWRLVNDAARCRKVSSLRPGGVSNTLERERPKPGSATSGIENG